MTNTPSLYESLRDALTDVNQWLQFAEAKNGILITLDMAIVVGIGTIATSWNYIPLPIVISSISISVGLMIGASVSFLSFFPRLEKHHGLPDGPNRVGGNLFFFGDIAGYDPQYYLRQVIDSVGTSERALRIHQDLANQIVTNSRIALRKFRLFSIGLKFSAGAIFFPSVAVLTYLGSR
jgi:hypothetical protein